MSGDIAGRIPKKPKGSSNGTGNGSSASAVAPPSQNGSSTLAADEDPMAQALKAMQAFREVTGEAAPKEAEEDKKPAAVEPAKTDEELAAEKKQREEEEAAAKLKQEEEEAAAKKKQEEEEAKERQRIKDGYAKRQAFKPKIATALDSLL